MRILEACEAYLQVHELFREVFSKIDEISPKKQMIMDNADTVLLCKKMEEMLDDLRKEVAKKRRSCESFACLRWTTEGTGEPIRGELSTCTPKIKSTARTPHPKKEPERLTR